MTSLAWMRPKLAELCSVTGPKWGETDHLSAYGYWVGDKFIGKEWRPDTSVAQAIRCWEALQNRGRNGDYFCCMDIRRPISEGWELVLRRGKHDEDHENPFVIIERQESLPQGICLAIAAALGWEEST
jgi:hypothetical protein